ncbi:MAG: hypothetical protein ACYDH5_16315 [Acidimicrobiales bacterium]
MLSSNELERIRYNAQERNTFLSDLAQRNRYKVRAVIRDVRRAIFDLDDAMQAFLIGANRALDTARTEDDGRGHNDPEAYCTWRGMLAVKEAIRQQHGRHDRPSIKQRAERGTIYAGAVAKKIDDNESACLFYADPNDYAETAQVNIDFAGFLGKLRGIDKEAALLLVYGSTDTRELVCTCAGQHSYIDDLARALDCKATRVFKILRRLRDVGKREFELA